MESETTKLPTSQTTREIHFMCRYISDLWKGHNIGEYSIDSFMAVVEEYGFSKLEEMLDVVVPPLDFYDGSICKNAEASMTEQEILSAWRKYKDGRDAYLAERKRDYERKQQPPQDIRWFILSKTGRRVGKYHQLRANPFAGEWRRDPSRQALWKKRISEGKLNRTQSTKNVKEQKARTGAEREATRRALKKGFTTVEAWKNHKEERTLEKKEQKKIRSAQALAKKRAEAKALEKAAGAHTIGQEEQ